MFAAIEIQSSRHRMISRTSSDAFAPLIGQTAQCCWLGYGNKLFLEFGQTQPLVDRETHPRGELGLSCDFIEWRIEQADHVIAGSEDERTRMEAGIREINGKVFSSGGISSAGDSILTFSDDIILRAFVITTEEDARWDFRDRQGCYSHLGPDRTRATAAQSVVERTRSETSGLQQLCKFLLDSEIWRVIVNVQHRFENGYEPSDLDSIRLDFRNLLPSPEGKGKHQPVASLRIDVNTCGLRLERSGEIVAACGDSSEKVLTQLKQIVGRRLLQVDIAPPSGDTSFVSEDGFVLRCFPAISSGGDVWSISSTQGDELVLGHGGRWSYKSGLL
ncbi:MAG TPA: hypothetical protein VFO46_07860 [Candidatus Sulfotelmatobacter sp.]|nr:hypothetical protein [Candidatus Sulfotelmatobacter sp.]